MFRLGWRRTVTRFGTLMSVGELSKAQDCFNHSFNVDFAYGYRSLMVYYDASRMSCIWIEMVRRLLLLLYIWRITRLTIRWAEWNLWRFVVHLQAKGPKFKTVTMAWIAQGLWCNYLLLSRKEECSGRWLGTQKFMGSLTCITAKCVTISCWDTDFD